MKRRADDRVAADADDRRVAEAELGQLVADLVRQRARARHEPDAALREDLRRDDADVRDAGRERARAVRAEQRHAARAHVRVDAEHVVGRDALGDADDGLDAGVDRLVDGVGGEARRHEDHRRVGALVARPRRRRCRRPGCPRRPARPCPASRRRPRSCRSRGCASVWNEPSRPVMPCTTRRVSAVDEDRHQAAAPASSTTRAAASEHRPLDVHVRRRRVGQQLAALHVVGAVEAHDDRHVDVAAGRARPGCRARPRRSA